MLSSKIRGATLATVVLFALVAVYSSISFPQTVAQEQAKPESEASDFWIDPVSNNQYFVGVSDHDQHTKLKDVQQERLVTARELMKHQTARSNNNQGLVEEVLESTRTLAEAELDVCNSNKERIAALDRVLTITKNTEKIASGFAKTGQERESTTLAAKVERLRFEITPEQERAKKEVSQKEAANSGPDAKAPPPKKGDATRTRRLPATVHAYESVHLFSQSPGFLKKQTVDIGDRVKRGQVLAVMDALDSMEAQLKHDRAVLDQEKARVKRAKASVDGAEAGLETVKLAVVQAEAGVKSAAASVRYRDSQLKRILDLFSKKGVEEKGVDESKERYEAAVEAEQAAKRAVAVAKVQVVAGTAKLERARAGVDIAEAGVAVARANLEKSQLHLSLAAISAPFDGIVTQRNFYPGAFIRSANERGKPLLAIQRIDKVRVIIAFSDRDFTLVDVGDDVEVEMEALPGRKWSAKVSRMAWTEDRKPHGMVEIDLPNPAEQIRPGMIGTVTIVLNSKKE